MFLAWKILTIYYSNCGTSKTPLWRRSPSGSTICNACGLYLKARNTARPMNLKRPPSANALSLTSEAEHSTHHISILPATPIGAMSGVEPTDSNALQVFTGSCPGGGRCNGTGGADGCNGCPAYNNRISKKVHTAKSARSDNMDENNDTSGHVSQEENSPSVLQNDQTSAPPTNAGGELSCKNCGTTITPLWRRDEAGHTICNACG